MAQDFKILAFAGSTRSGSWNKKLIKIAAAGAEKAGAQVTCIDLKDYALPLYDGDLESQEGLSENTKKLKELFKTHHAVMISAPEYNSSISGVLKNTIDWLSRPHPSDPPGGVFKNKVIALYSTSPGAFGGIRGLIPLRAILENLGAFVLPEQVCVPKAMEAFDAAGALKDEKTHTLVSNLAASLVSFGRKLTS